MNYNVGSYVFVKEKSVSKINLMFGDMIWRIDEISPVSVKLVLVGGTGPSASAGRTMLEDRKAFDKSIASGEFKLATGNQMKSILSMDSSNRNNSKGIVEI